MPCRRVLRVQSTALTRIRTSNHNHRAAPDIPLVDRYRAQSRTASGATHRTFLVLCDMHGSMLTWHRLRAVTKTDALLQPDRNVTARLRLSLAQMRAAAADQHCHSWYWCRRSEDVKPTPLVLFVSRSSIAFVRFTSQRRVALESYRLRRSWRPGAVGYDTNTTWNYTTTYGAPRKERISILISACKPNPKILYAEKHETYVPYQSALEAEVRKSTSHLYFLSSSLAFMNALETLLSDYTPLPLIVGVPCPASAFAAASAAALLFCLRVSGNG